MPANDRHSFIESGIPTRGAQRDLDQARQALQTWFTKALPGRADLRVTEVVAPATSGVANETLLCETTWTTDGLPRTQGYVVRVNSPDFLYKDVDLERHASMYRALAAEPGIPVPRVIGSEQDPGLLGQPFFVMERLHGQVPADAPPFHTTGWVHDLPPEHRRTLWRNAVEVMVRMHQVDTTKLGFLDRPHLGHGGLEQDLGYWFDFGAWAARGRDQPVLTAAADWLRAHTPAASTAGLAWGDSRPQNLMFSGVEVIAVFDWDMVCLAGAESDLAWWTIMDYTNTETVGVERLAGIGSPADTVRLWQDLAGRQAQNMDFHLVYAAYRLGVILVRLGDLYAATGSLPADETAHLVEDNFGIQFLTQMLGLPRAQPITLPWPGLDV